ncbi:asparagine synthase-domain-containing protein [Gorgonomyces haynaldii]|nr:asparagine synthase-domain-containing protein [Gorgonomyces haynaldii]
MNFGGFVLSLRGHQSQPIQQHGHILLFNGEVYDGFPIESTENDGALLLQKLVLMESEQEMMDFLSQINAEFAIVYYHPERGIYFGRDFLGRRSLCVLKNDGIIIASAAIASLGEWQEVETGGLYRLDPNSLESVFVPWNQQVLPNTQLNTSLEALDVPVDQFHDMLLQATKIRVQTVPEPQPNDARVAILFSGGLDCITLAALAHFCLPPHEPIDLLNVAFENPRIMKHREKTQDTTDAFTVPDRLTGLKGYQELSQLYEREWRFVEINVPYEEAMEHKDHIISLLYPLYTVMDLSIAMAFWFASRGSGVYNNQYTSQARVLISGLGADEQLGGYGRHQVSFIKQDWTGLLEELQKDVSRISTRNLGRDDRIMADHGKEVRFPFLDNHVVNYLSGLGVKQKTDPRLQKGVGDKMLLRRVALKLGLERASLEPKRAVQFGARTAKMVESKQKGQDLL